MGLAILGSIGTAVYRSRLGRTMPAAIPVESAATARDTLGGAVGVAGQLPGGLGTDLIEAARLAFTAGLRVTAVISVVLAVGIAVVAAALLRTVPSPSDADDEASLGAGR